MVYPPFGWSSQFVRDVAHPQSAVLGITVATALKTSHGVLCSIIVVGASTATGAVYDCANTASTSTSNRVFTIPATVGVYTLALPCSSGVTVAPGAGMQLSVSLA